MTFELEKESMETRSGSIRKSDDTVGSDINIHMDAPWQGEELLRQIMDHSHDCIKLLDLEGRLLWMNCCGQQLMGIKDIGPLLSTSWLEFWKNEDHVSACAALTLAKRHGAGSFTGYCPSVNGVAKWWDVALSSIPNAEGQPERILAISRDITDRVQAESEVRKLATFAELNPNPVLEFTGDGTLRYFNPATLAMARTVGYLNVEQLLPIEVNLIVAECMASGRPRLRLETKHGQSTLSWSFYPIDGQQMVHCYVGDITERLQLEEQFRQSQKMEAVGQLAGGVAHDFNNLLTVIKGHIGLLQLRGLISPDTISSIQQIDQATDRAANLTRQLLMFSRQQAMQPANYNLNGLVANLTKMLRRLLTENIELRVEYAPTALVIRADEGMVEQVLLNLVVNARDAMPKGGKLAIVTEPVELDAAAARRLGQERSGTFACLTVRDSGTGIAPEILPRIFEPFYTTKGMGKGTGLGLATAHGIMQQHGGWIRVESEVGRGTSFRVYFPRLATAALPPPADKATAPVQGGHESILLVEDDAAVRVLVEGELTGLGYRVFSAPSGLAALQVWEVQQQSISLLLTDLIMPDGVTGRELAVRLRARNPQVAIVYMSGYNNEVGGGDFMLEAGSNFIAKPFDLASLAKIVRDSLDRSASQPPFPVGL